jgi:protein-L-isoaspartate(D-aspartate) O-methyltransferase
VDVIRQDDHQRPWWLSAPWLRDAHHHPKGQELLDHLATDHQAIAGPLEASEDATGFRGWLFATRPQGLTTAALGDPMWRIGYTHPDSAALTDIRTATTTITTGDTSGADALNQWANAWRTAGRPGLNDLTPRLAATTGGWSLYARAR